MTGMLEKMARAMYEAAPGVYPTEGPQWDWDWMISEGWSLPEVFRKRARAALQAIREPSEGMCVAGERYVDIHDAVLERDRLAQTEEAFTAMIDAILAEQA